MANHEKTYGICENKCRVEVYSKENADNLFAPKDSVASAVRDSSGDGAIQFAADDTIITMSLDTPFTTSQIKNYFPIVKMYVDSGVRVPNGFKWTYFIRDNKLIIMGDNTDGNRAFIARFNVLWIKAGI